MKSRLVAVVGLAILALLASSCGSSPITVPSNTSIIMQNGFGDPANGFSWSMAAFKGKLYVGTARYEQCVERQTAQHYFPLSNSYKSDSTATCPTPWYSMDLRAEIWEYDPASLNANKWRRVYQSVTVPNPQAPGYSIARDIGFRNMIVIGDRLFALGVTANEFVPELADTYAPELLSTSDGTNWSATDVKLAAQDPSGKPAPLGVVHTPFGYQKPMGMRAAANVNGQLYVTATGGLTGDGAVVKVDNPGTPEQVVTQVSPPTIAAYELEAFNGQLYVGTGSATDGYGVWRLSTWSNPPSMIQVLGGGAGRGKAITSVVSMKAFKGKLYVGSSGWYQTILPASELIAISADDHYELVVGAPRTLPNGTQLAPTSGFLDNFGNVGNAHFWRMLESGNGLYLGTNDWTWTFMTAPGLENLIYSWEYGFDIFGTCDGTFWWGVTRTAFGSSGHNFGARTMADLNGHYYVGSANHVDGTSVYQNNDVSTCSPAPSSLVAGGTGESAAGVTNAAPKGVPNRLLADPEVCGTVLSWDSQTGEPTYVVKRAEKVTTQVTAPAKPEGLGAGIPDSPPSGGTTTGNVTTAGEFETVGVTKSNTFVDRSTDPTKEYVYQVSSDASNGTGAVALAFSPARSQGEGAVDAIDNARRAKGLDVDGLRASRDVESASSACSK